ncbi:MAG: UDP-glucose 4-epimerase GalE [Oligosphaeraceae bacterium]|nr:UDP-glucose 4-epimerase GalE [Oligosphaeraceae bacterium]
MHVFVTGGAGYIGSCCCEYLLDQGHQVTVFDALLTGYRQAVDPRANFIEGNLADYAAIDSAIKKASPDGLIHFAAFIEVGESMSDPLKYFRNNVANALNLCQAAVENQVPKLVFSSTAAVYGMPSNIPISEDEPTDPINPYGEAKLMFEKILSWQHRLKGLHYCALRYFNAAGASRNYGEAHRPESHLIPLIMEAAEGKRKLIRIFGDDYDTPDGTCIRDYVHVLDLAQAHLLALQSDFCGSLNLGSGFGHSVKEVVEMVRRVSGKRFTVEVVARRPGDPARLIADSSAAKRILGWQPVYDSLEQIVQSAWDWRCKNPDGYSS